MKKKLTNFLICKYNYVFWVKNYIKTVSATALCSSGVGLVITGELTRFHNRGWSDAELILGITCIILALLITFLLDLWAKRKDKEMMEDIEEYIDERAEEIATHLVLKHLNELDKK